ncbi:hypothetical protein [Allopontixanthobacter sediminis]|uniref:Oligosaccharide repeat unit polymerase n=1 Tax=Allopontixanthobacter sediminis TaxID=1689985 RepID=A0A845B269_9SPHN|nr:hypothetical protein [Allopontixanthobacter sediminis]MXP44398.1 hypothetical protein [Allopontixanthobacter sediminis]
MFIRKVFDFVSVAFIGQLIYFSPGFYGYVANPYAPGVLPSIPLVDQVYTVWQLCLGSTLLTGLLYRPKPAPIPALRTTLPFDLTAIALIAASFGYLLFFTGEELLSSDKNEVLGNIDRVFLLFASVCQIAMICFLVQAKWLRSLVPALGLAYLLYAGFRAEFAISLIAVAAYIARREGIFVFLRFRYLMPGLAAAALLVAYKPFLTAYRLGNWQVLDSLQMSDNFFETMILQFEPFLSQAVLNEVLSRNFQVAPGSLFDALVASVPFLAPLLGLRPEDAAFNHQDFLFPNIAYGITGTPQSQFFAAMGWVGLLIFLIAKNFFLVLASRGLASSKPAIQLFCLAFGAFLAFYIQRNDLANALTLINRMLIAVFVCWLGAWILTAGKRPEPRQVDEPDDAPTRTDVVPS